VPSGGPAGPPPWIEERGGLAANGTGAARAPADERRDRFERLYREYSGMVLGYVLRRTADPHDAADVVAEVFVVVWRRLDDVPAGDGARLWLYVVARNTLANHDRGNRRRGRLAARAGAELDAFAAALPADQGLDRVPIATALAALCPADREVLGLIGWEGLDPGEAAVVLGCSRATVRVRLHRARRRFAQQLRERGVEVPQRAARAGHGLAGWALADPDEEGVT
jgi:RNA polymerase sigma factor (sigma-70 family)